MFALTNVMNFFANKLAGLGARRFALALGFFRSLDSLFSRHGSSSSYGESGCCDGQHNLTEARRAINVPVRDEKTALWNQRPDPPELYEVKLFAQAATGRACLFPRQSSRVLGRKCATTNSRELAYYCPAAETVWPLLRSLGEVFAAARQTICRIAFAQRKMSVN